MKLLEKLAQTKYVRKAVEDQADLSAFQEKPSVRVLLGISAIAISYLIGWPAISVLAPLSIHWGMPLLIAVGGPLLYGLSHLIFLLGMYLAGAKYSKIFLRWAARVAAERLTHRKR